MLPMTRTLRLPAFRRTALRGLLAGLLVASLGVPLQAQDLDAFEENVTEFTLDNGMHFIVVERHEAPVVSFITHADVGGVNEITGQTGIAHMFEHMAFKGTSAIGTRDIEREREAMEAVDLAYAAYRAELHKGPSADPARLEELKAAFEESKEAAQEWVQSNEFGEILDRNGVDGLNAYTSSDATVYFYSLPSNKLELWFSLESDRFLDPVLREFYVERDVVMEERRMRTESSPVGRLVEELLSTAYKAHPYGRPIIGHMSDLQSFTREEAEEFFEAYYRPNNLTVALVGDVDPERARELAETYFGRLPAGPTPEPVETVEPAQLGERRVVLEEESQPLLLLAYHRPSISHPDNAVYTVIADILGRGRTSRLYDRMVEQDKSAAQTSVYERFPGDKYPSLFLFFTVPTPGSTAEANEETILEELERLKEDLVSDEELEKAKTRARADLVRQLGSNLNLGVLLTDYAVFTGDWRNLFRQLDAIEAVTAEDIRRVARETFTDHNRTVALIRTAEPETAMAE